MNDEQLEAAGKIVDAWTSGYGACPHLPKTRVCECEDCLRNWIFAALTKAREDGWKDSWKECERSGFRGQEKFDMGWKCGMEEAAEIVESTKGIIGLNGMLRKIRKRIAEIEKEKGLDGVK